MDELEISGKRYISSRRAAKEHRYHADYIGQLVRGGKVAGTKVGRAWYVEAESLTTYLAQEIKKPIFSIQPEKKNKEELKKYQQIRHITIAGSNADGDEEGEIEKTSLHQEVAKKTSLKYISDNEPLFPAFKTTSQIFDTQIANMPPKQREKISIPYRKIEKTQSWFRVSTLLFLTIITLGFFIFGSTHLVYKVTAQQGAAINTSISFK